MAFSIPVLCQANTMNHGSKYYQLRLKYIEKKSNGKLGVFIVGNNVKLKYNANRYFPMCSTAKLFVVADILKLSISHHSLLVRRIKYTKNDISKSGYAPVTKNYIHDGMTVLSLCRSAIEHSDNTAMNLLIRIIGGPKKVTQFARSIGDKQFRLDRYEPNLNSAIPNDLRDTSTPYAMVSSLRNILFGNILPRYQKTLLLTWLINNKTGNLRIRNGLNTSFIVGDKTGTGQYGTTNDIGIVFNNKYHYYMIGIFFTQNNKYAKPNNQLIAKTTHTLEELLNR